MAIVFTPLLGTRARLKLKAEVENQVFIYTMVAGNSPGYNPGYSNGGEVGHRLWM